MFEASSSSLMIEGSFLRSSTTVLRKTSAILLQIVMVSPGNHLVKNHESQSRASESQLKKNESEIENAGPGPSCNQTFNLKIDSKTLYCSILILKYSPSILKAQQRPKEICITATEITRTGYFYKYDVQIYRPTGRMP